MKSPLALCLALLALLPGAAAAQQAPADPVATATRFLDLLAAGDGQAASRDFNEPMKAAATPEKLAETWKVIQTQLGPFQRRTGIHTEKQGGYDVVVFTSEFERDTVGLRVVLDGAGKIAGFTIVPAPAAPPSAGPAYARPDSFSEREVTVGSGEWELPGTLTLPKGQGPFPAVVLVHGSGPHDRDETVFGNKPFRDLAWGLASRGIAVLRYEKRTRHHNAKVGTVAKLTLQEETVDDALAAAGLLRRTSGVDPKRVYVLGHSLGGTAAPRIGQRDPALAGVIILAGSARPLEEVILEQISYLAAQDGQVSEEEKQRIEEVRQGAARVKALKPDATEAILGIPASYWLDLQGYNPPEAAKTLKQPLLILQGERDYQVTLADFEAWKKALAGRADVTFKSYPKLNHLLVEGEGKSYPDEYTRPGHVGEAVVADIAAWINAAKPAAAER